MLIFHILYIIPYIVQLFLWKQWKFYVKTIQELNKEAVYIDTDHHGALNYAYANFGLANHWIVSEK